MPISKTIFIPRRWKNFPKAEQIGFASSAKAIEAMVKRKSGKAAVICSEKAAKKYGLRIIAKNIEDQKGNKTNKRVN